MRKLVLPLLAACGLLVATAPIASAGTNKKQWQKIGAVSGAVKGAQKQIEQLRDTNLGQTAAINRNGDGLTALQSTVSVVITTATAALNQLKDGLTTVGAGLTSLKTLATSTEYGFGQVVTVGGGGATTAQAGSFVVTPDIPDTVQQAQTSQTFVAQSTGVVAVLYGVRSSESDGTGSTDPAAHCRVTVIDTADGASSSTTANAALGGLPFQPVNEKSAQTSTDSANSSFPFALKTSGSDADKTSTFVSSVSVNAGEVYTVTMSCVDTTPSATDPSA